MKRIGIIIFSVFIAVCTDVSGKQKAPEEKPVRHYIDIYGAGGVSHWNYPLTGGEVTIGGAFSAGARSPCRSWMASNACRLPLSLPSPC